MRYDAIVVDVANVAHRVFDHKKESPSYVSKKQVYKQAVCNFICYLDTLIAEYLHSTGDVYLLFDNMTSRVDLQSTFYFADRKEAYAKYKADRAKQPKEFYNSINLLKYYYLTMPQMYHTVQINRLEADDLVEPLLRTVLKDKSLLLITNDLDWARFLSTDVHWLPHGTQAETTEDLSLRIGFPVSKKSITAFKVIFGDASDNIPSLAPAKMQQYFPAMLDAFSSADDLPYLATREGYIERYPLLQYVRDNDRQCRINLQLVNSIAVADKHILNVIATGRNSVVSQKAVRYAVGLDEATEGFQFGGVRRPRV